MKTIRKSMLLMLGTFASIFAFPQINLGLQSTSQAAINSTINAAAITKANVATAQATKSTVNAVTIKTADITTKTITVAKVNQQQFGQTANIKTGIQASNQSNTNTGNSKGQVSFNPNSSADAGVNLNGSKIIDKAGNTTSTTTVIAEKKVLSTAEFAKTTNANTSGEVKTESSVKLTKQ